MKNEKLKIYGLAEGHTAFRNMIQTDSDKTKLGVSSLDFLLRGGLRPGEVMVMSGKTSVGKTGVVVNFALNSIKINPNKKALFFSFEMSLPSIVERVYQIEFQKTSGELISDIDRLNIKDSHLKNLYYITEPCPVQMIENYINYFKETVAADVGLVVIDYLGLVQSRGASAYEKQSESARQIKEIAKRTDTSILVLTQVSKQYNSETEIDLNSTRDSGSIVEAADFFLGIWKNKETPETETDYNLTLGLLKNRRGMIGTTQIKMSKKNLAISETTITPQPRIPKGYKSFYDNEPEEDVI